MSTNADDIMLKKKKNGAIGLASSLLAALFHWRKNSEEENASLQEQSGLELPDPCPFFGSEDLNNQNERDELDCNPEHTVFTVGIKGTF